MRSTRLGPTDITVSRLGLGTMTWGSRTPEADVVAMLKRFLAAGGNLIDTAAAYGNGEVEALIGRLLAHTVARSELVIATKSGYVAQGSTRFVDTSQRALLNDLAGSLRRLGTDYVDLWQVHAWGDAPLEETLAALDTAVTKGWTRAVGVSNFVGWQTAASATWQIAREATPLATVQAEYSLLTRRAELEVLPAAQYLGLGFLPWSALGRGVLSGQYDTGTPRSSRADLTAMAWFVEQYLDPASRRIVKAVMVAADGLDLAPVQVALAWVRDAPGVTAPLVGPRTVTQLIPLLDTDVIDLPAEVTAALDDVSGGPNLARHEAT